MKSVFRQSVAGVTLTAYFFVFCGCSTSPVVTATESTPVTAEELIATHRNSAPASLRVGQLAELTIAYCLRSEHEKAVEIASVGLSKATSADQRAGFYALIAQNQGALGRNEEAGQSALAGQRLSPDNKLLAFYRIANFERSGNRVQADIARNHLMRLDPDFALNPKCELLTLATIVIVTVIIAAATVTVVVAKEINKADTEAKVRALKNMGETALHVFGKALDVTATFAEIGAGVGGKKMIR